MPKDKHGRDIQVRARRYLATVEDMVAFFNLILGSIPEAKLYNMELTRQASLPRIAPEEWGRLDDPFHTETEILFHDAAWQPVFVKQESEGRYYLDNLPKPSLLFYRGGVHRFVVKAIGRPVHVPEEGYMNANNLVDDVGGKKIVDKIFRLHRQFFSNKGRWIDLMSRRAVREERIHNWYGPNLARLCREQKETYLDLHVDPHRQEYFGCLPVD